MPERARNRPTQPAGLYPNRDEVLRNVDLPALLEELGRSRGLDVRRNQFPCPSSTHEQSGGSPPARVSVTADGQGLWHCFGCGAGGSAVDALLVSGEARDVADAFAQLRGDRGVALAHTGRGPRARSVPAAPVDPARVMEARRELASYVADCHERLFTPGGAPILRRLHERGLTDDEIIAHQIGYDPGYRMLKRAKETLPAPAGAAFTLPLFDEAGTVVYAQARLVGPASEGPKFFNPYSKWIGPSPRVGLIYSPATADRQVLVVCEGVCDAILAARYFETRAIIGAGQPDDRVADRLVAAAAGRPIIVCFDTDPPGKTGAEPAGQGGAKKLAALLHDRGAPAASITLPVGDVTDLHRVAPQAFGQTLHALVSRATWRAQPDHPLLLRGPPLQEPFPRQTARGEMSLPDPLGRKYHMFGTWRTNLLGEWATGLAKESQREDRALLESRSAELGPPFEGLRGQAVLESLRIERQEEVVAKRLHASIKELDDPARGKVARTLVEQDREELVRLFQAADALGEAGRDVDTWFHAHARRAAESLGVTLALERQMAISQEVAQLERDRPHYAPRMRGEHAVDGHVRAPGHELEMS